MLPEHDHPWLASRYGGPVLLKAAMHALMHRISAASRMIKGETASLADVMRGFGGGPKPWGSVLAMMLNGALPFEPIACANMLKGVRLSTSRRELIHSFDREAIRKASTQEDALEILNLSIKKSRELSGMSLPSSDAARARSWALSGRAVGRMAAKRISSRDLMARS